MQAHRGRRIVLLLVGTACLLVAATAGWFFRDDLAARWRYQTVKGLLDPERREGVLREVLSWQRYRGEPRYQVTEADPIQDVVLCPQKRGLPLFVVLLDSSVPGHFEIIDGDGTIIPVYGGWNVLEGELQDINGDDVFDIVIDKGWTDGTHMGAMVHVVEVFPIRREQTPILRVAHALHWELQLLRGETSGLLEAALGPKDGPSGTMVPEVRYRWSTMERRYLGPDGGFDLPFLRLPSDDDTELRRFARESWGRRR